MLESAGCTACESCDEILSRLNAKLGSIADKLLYNIRYGLSRQVDRKLFQLLTFYKGVLTDICNDEDCGCYTVSTTTCTTTVNTGDPAAVVNHCICGCCPPLNPVCTGTSTTAADVASVLTTENILERVKILIA